MSNKEGKEIVLLPQIEPAIGIPTPRWTAYDVMRFKIKMPPEVPMTHQEFAWTASIWYTAQ